MRLFSTAYCFIFKNILEDTSRRYLSKPFSVLLYLGFFIVRHLPTRYNMLFKAHRFSYFKFIEDKIIEELPITQNYILDMLPNDNDISEFTNQNRIVVLKAPRLDGVAVLERGVVLIKFSTTFIYCLKHINCSKLQEHFHIVLEPSWAGYCLPEILGWTTFKEPIVIQCSEIKDYEFIARLNSNLIPVRFGSSDWVDHRLFKYCKKDNPKYDAIYVSNYTSIKRNHVFLKALQQINKKGYRAALVCNSWGDDKKNVKILFDHYNLQGKLDIYESLTQSELNELLANSKVNLLLSLKEGSNRSIFEAFFTDTPGVVLSENIGVNKSYINEETGKLIKETELVNTLIYFSTNWKKYQPRSWAMANISITKTKEKLDLVLEGICEKSNQPWTHGTLLKVNTPEATYFDDSLVDKMPNGTEVVVAFEKTLEDKNHR